MNANFMGLLAMEPSAATAKLSPLPEVAAGRTVRIRALCASPEVSCQLREIGLHEGQFVRLVTCGANIICQVCNARLALNAKLARLILVEQLG
jgi:Fe2+ transport system protein FeoA